MRFEINAERRLLISAQGWALATLGKKRHIPEDANPERVRSRSVSQLLQSCDKTKSILARGFKANPGLELANAFGVKFERHQYHFVGIVDISEVPSYDARG